MKTAKEMFEELGYIQDGEDSNGIDYKKSISKDEYYIFEFDIKQKMFSKYKKRNDTIRDLFITFEEFKAIQKQIEELGWESEEEK